MTKPVTLSDSAFAALRREKKAGESDSDVVKRLVQEAHEGRTKKDPFRLVGAKLGPGLGREAHLRLLKEMDEHELAQPDPWEGHASP